MTTKIPLYPQGTEGYCFSCGDLLFVFKVDAFRGTAIHAGQLYGDRGQAPFQSQTMIECKKCGAILNQSLIRFRRPAW